MWTDWRHLHEHVAIYAKPQWRLHGCIFAFRGLESIQSLSLELSVLIPEAASNIAYLKGNLFYFLFIYLFTSPLVHWVVLASQI